MNSSDSDSMRRLLLLEQAIRKQLDPLIRKATETTLLLDGNRDMEVSQLRNLQVVAVESRSVEVVINFIRYQIARNGRAWGIERGSFGHTVIADLRGEVKKLADQAIGQVAAVVGASPEVEALRDDAYVRLIQMYLSYLNRSFYFARRSNSFAELREVLDA